MDHNKKKKGFKRSFATSSSSPNTSTPLLTTMNNQTPSEGEISLAKRLVHTDKEIRDSALSAVITWLNNQINIYNSDNTNPSTITELPDNNDPLTIEMMKMWKALFYCIWMSDKPIIQNELVTNLAQLLLDLPIHTPGGQIYCLLYIKCCFDTLYREWLGLDRYRIDKYLLFIRRIMNISFTLGGKFYQISIKNNKKLNTNKDSSSSSSSSITLITLLTNLYTQYIYQPPNGIRLHIIDIYYEELCSALPTINDELFSLLFIPIYKALENIDDKLIFQRIVDTIFTEGLFTTTTKNDTITLSSDNKIPSVALPNINYTLIAQQLFRIGANPQTRGGYRDAVYALHKECVTIAKSLGHVDKSTNVYGTSTSKKQEDTTTITTINTNTNKSTTNNTTTKIITTSTKVSSKPQREKNSETNVRSSSETKPNIPRTKRKNREEQQEAGGKKLKKLK